MKKIILISIAACLLPACSSIQTIESDLSADVGIIQRDLPGFLTGVNALWTQVGTVITSQQFNALLTSYGIKPDTQTTIAKVVGIGNGTLTVTNTLVAALAAQGQTAQVTTK